MSDAGASVLVSIVVVVFKQKTAYEMRISDWSSDVCSSDLTVYLGEQIDLSREVAIKVMATQALSDEVSRRRFENEVRTIARLEHPHVVRIHELGRTDRKSVV